MRSLAPPIWDKIFIWSAVVAGCGIMALLGRHAAITRFGTDEFTGNVLFVVFFVLTIGLYCGFQPAIESLFDRIFRRKESVAIMSTPAGEEVEVTVVDNHQSKMEYSAPIDNTAVEEEPYFTDNDYTEDYSGGEIVEDKETNEAQYIIIDGKKVYEAPIDVDDVVFVELEHNIREYSSLQERIETRGEYPYFEDYMGGHGLDEVLESDVLYNEWVSFQHKHIRKELELGIYRVRAYPESNDSIGCFTKTAKEKRIKEDNGNIRIEEWGGGSVYLRRRRCLLLRPT